MPTPDLLRPRDGDALRAELRHVVKSSGVPVVFGGEVSISTLHLTEFHGTRTRGLDGLAIPSMFGLGGRVMDQRHPAAVSDYGSSDFITHDYDRPVLGEGLRSILAVPVVVEGASRAVMYAAVRERGPIGDRVANTMVQASRRLSQEIAVRDEVDRRLRMLDTRTAGPDSTAATETLRDVHAELRALSTRAADTTLRSSLTQLSERIARALHHVDPDDAVTLSARETDVLAQVALGCTNAQAAQRLSLGPETVKSYLRSAMGKLGARSRHEAVVAARRHGLLP
ncbi:helix-turn-helix transcriptional regulator [Rhodococcoides kyotonense]|uniref:DNA-binding response regulator, NarL/FixJ family, contains REC and HTH domains n=1 Tax=Rhodococcoides kyotonense TaxID=398843 RepID=A0A239D9S3_9NOCA|nr:LuxR C-terminal-related transcriptional regulator [Rhodococcus kyotonensis]SNS28808.1 DNA-binding response regulator, NarL/FixJ family, contains REC and HTH domains [Rhodococcus kyotonensis]